MYFSESGWTDAYNCERWLEEVFIPFAKKNRVDSTKPIVLAMDGHDTHEKPELQRIIYKHLDEENLEIVVFCFPSKCTHKCQPLDVVVFSSIEHKWQEVCSCCIKKKTPINRFTVIPEYVQGTQGAMSVDLIAKAFEKTGIYPVTRTVFTNKDFAPSKVSSSQVHVPDSFPAKFPSSDPIEADPDYEPPLDDDTDAVSLQSKSESAATPSEIDVKDVLSMEHRMDCDDMGSQDSEDHKLMADDRAGTHSCTAAEGDSASPSDCNVQEDNPSPSLDPKVSGLLISIANMETSVIHMTRSASARLDLFTAAPPKIVSVEKDRRRSPNEMFNELCMLQEQLTSTYQALGRTLGQLSAANAHCTSIHRELGHVCQELENTT